MFDEEDINYYNNQKEEVINFIGSNPTEKLYNEPINIGDKIVVYFYPYSQKHIYRLYPKYGIVVENTNNPNEDFSLNNIRLKNNNTEYNVCSIDNGYDYIIVRLP